MSKVDEYYRTHYIKNEKELLKKIRGSFLFYSLTSGAMLCLLGGLLISGYINGSMKSIVEEPIGVIFFGGFTCLFLYIFIKNFKVLINPRKYSDTYKRFDGDVNLILEAIKDVNEKMIYSDKCFKLSNDNICEYYNDSEIINRSNFSHYKIVERKVNGFTDSYDLKIYDTKEGFIIERYPQYRVNDLNKIVSLIKEKFELERFKNL